MQRNSLHRPTLGIVLLVVSVLLTGCPPPEQGRTGSGRGANNTGRSATKQPSASAQVAPDTSTSPMQIESESFGATKDDEEVTLWTLTNNNGMVVQMMDYGASVVRVEVPDREWNMADVTLGYDTLEEYIHDTAYFGAIIGR